MKKGNILKVNSYLWSLAFDVRLEAVSTLKGCICKSRQLFTAFYMHFVGSRPPFAHSRSPIHDQGHHPEHDQERARHDNAGSQDRRVRHGHHRRPPA